MARMTGDGTDEGSTPPPSSAPTPPPGPPVANAEPQHAAPEQPAKVGVRVTGPAFTDAVEVEAGGERVTVTAAGTQIPAALVDEVIARAAEIDVTVEKED